MNPESIRALLDIVEQRRASDLYLTFGALPTLRILDKLVPATETPINDQDIARYIAEVLSPDKQELFARNWEMNTAFHYSGTSRFRINLYVQQGHQAMVIRRIQMQIPTLEELMMPSCYAESVLLKRGLILIAGPTGSGKSTSLAAMVGHRNRHGSGHIITVEDPLEFIHVHGNCIVSQRDVGLDTHGYAIALKHALRQQPDIVVIGEVRDRDVMEQAIHFAETSHLCIATLHANNSSQAIERVLNFFPEERHEQVLLNLSLNLKAVFSQRLVENLQKGKTLALEIMLNRGLIRQLIAEGKIPEIRDMIEKGTQDGMQTFDQHLLHLYKEGVISEAVAMAEADSSTNLRLMIGKEARQVGIEHGTDLSKHVLMQSQRLNLKNTSTF